MKVIIVSAFNEEEDKMAAFEAGANAYVSKPVHVPTLFSILYSYLKTMKND